MFYDNYYMFCEFQVSTHIQKYDVPHFKSS